MASINHHNFYCMKCGKSGIPLARKKSLQHPRFHRKKLYCPWCKMTVNHIECKTDEDIYIFKEQFEKGEFQKEMEESLEFIEKEGI